MKIRIFNHERSYQLDDVCNHQLKQMPLKEVQTLLWLNLRCQYKAKYRLPYYLVKYFMAKEMNNFESELTISKIG